jgi:hypothetical protein
MMLRRIILLDIEPDDLILGVRAAKYLLSQFRKDAILAYGDGGSTKDFYAVRNKSSITVRPVRRAALNIQQRASE